MTTIKEAALAFVPQQTKNITELDKVSVQIVVQRKTVAEGTEKEFSYNYTLVDGEEYRVPVSVLKQLKSHLEEKPNITHFKVKASGSGKNTEYTVIPL